MQTRKPVSKREKWARSFTDEFVKNHLDKLEEVDKLPEYNGHTGKYPQVDWDSNGYHWYIIKQVLREEGKPDLLEYRLVRRTPRMTKSINEKVYGDSCWVIRLENLWEIYGKHTHRDNTMNTHNMNHSGFNFNLFSCCHPVGSYPAL